MCLRLIFQSFSPRCMLLHSLQFQVWSGKFDFLTFCSSFVFCLVGSLIISKIGKTEKDMHALMFTHRAHMTLYVYICVYIYTQTYSRYSVFIRYRYGQAWWHTPEILALVKLKQKDREFETSLSYIVRQSQKVKINKTQACN